MKKRFNKYAIFKSIVAALLVVPVATIPNILTDVEHKKWIISNYGTGYWVALWILFAIIAIGFLFLTSELTLKATSKSKISIERQFIIPLEPNSSEIINRAILALSNSELEETLRILIEINHPLLNAEIDLFNSRLAEFKRIRRYAIESTDNENRIFNQITKDIRELISVLEFQLNEQYKNINLIRKHLEKRYRSRLDQKLASRQPVNLLIKTSREGTSDEGALNFMTLEENEVRSGIYNIFFRSNGRLLLIGSPGAGKTTLVLQLALQIIAKHTFTIPVVLNLATWRSRFETFDEWLEEILPIELGASNALTKETQKKGLIILLLDGFDEVDKDLRSACINAIGIYGSVSDRKYLISSRLDEYKTTKDAPVNIELELKPLTIDQIEANLLASSHIQPESKRLLNALIIDVNLREAIKNPFYLNTAQLLFASGKNWSDFFFTAPDKEGREKELVNRFVIDTLGKRFQYGHPQEKVSYWLSFLAFNLRKQKLVTIELWWLQYHWLGTKREKYSSQISAISFLVNRMIPGLAFGLMIGIIFGLLGKLFLGQLGSVLLIAVFTIIGDWITILETPLIKEDLPIYFSDTIKTTNYRFFSIFHFKKIIGEDMFVWKSTMGIITFYFILEFNLWLTIGITLVLILIPVIIVLILLYLTFARSIEIDIDEIDRDLVDAKMSILQITKPYQRFVRSFRSLHFSILQHFHLRYLFSREGLLPFQLIDFLNDLSRYNILETDGGAWRFRHRILQEYFAEKWVEPNFESKK